MSLARSLILQALFYQSIATLVILFVSLYFPGVTVLKFVTVYAALCIYYVVFHYYFPLPCLNKMG